MHNRKRTVLFSLLINGIIALLFIRAEVWNFHDGLIHEIIYGGAVFILCAVIPLLVYCTKWMRNIYEAVLYWILSLKNHWRKIAVWTGAVLLYIPAGILCSLVLSGVFHLEHNRMLVLICVSLILCIISVCLLWKQAKQYPEKIFLSLCLTAGSFFILAAPAEVGICWDDNFHYDGTIAAVTGNGAYYASDAEIIDHVADVALEKKFYDEKSREERTELINDLYEKRELMPYSHANLGLYSITYLPHAVGIVIGRGLSLPYTWTFRLEKFINLLFYSLTIYFAVKKLRFGKILMAAVGLLPTNLFMVSSFSYDPWITALLMLGFAYFFAVMQDENHVITNGEMAVMLGSFFFGCLPKAVYFVLMFPLLFIPKNRFENEKKRRWWIFLVFLTAFALASSFILPRLISGAGTGDTRGGEDVNPGEQIRFILNNPLGYADILFRFNLGYLNPLNAFQYMVNYAYLGFGYNRWICTLVLAVLMFTDKAGIQSKTKLIIFAFVIAMIGVIVLVPTALYVTYTPVGADTVAGCQFRYLIPVVFAGLYMNSFDKIRNPLNSTLYAVLPQVMMTAVFIADMGISLYQYF